MLHAVEKEPAVYVQGHLAGISVWWKGARLQVKPEMTEILHIKIIVEIIFFKTLNGKSPVHAMTSKYKTLRIIILIIIVIK